MNEIVKASGYEQLALFEIPTRLCSSCRRVIRIAREATHPCFYLD